MLKSRSLVLLFLLAMLTTPFASAVEPDEILDDPILEARARELSKELRCLVCQNENIDSSHAPLARDLRVLVRERLVAGDTDKEVLAYVVDRYGDFVLLKPPVQSNTFVLWLAPVLFMILGGLGLYLTLKGRKPTTAAVVGGANEKRQNTSEDDLTDEERDKLRDLLNS